MYCRYDFWVWILVEGADTTYSKHSVIFDMLWPCSLKVAYNLLQMKRKFVASLNKIPLLSLRWNLGVMYKNSISILFSEYFGTVLLTILRHFSVCMSECCLTESECCVLSFFAFPSSQYCLYLYISCKFWNCIMSFSCCILWVLKSLMNFT